MENGDSKTPDKVDLDIHTFKKLCLLVKEVEDKLTEIYKLMDEAKVCCVDKKEG